MKKELRQHTLKALQGLSDRIFEKECQDIKDKLLLQKEWQEAKTVAITISRGREIPTRPIIEEAWRQAKTVAVPKCHPETKAMAFHIITDFDQLESVYYGLFEPKPEETEIIHKENLDMIIVPGIVFDELGYRIGFGGGYYDRFLADYAGATLSLALDLQVLSDLPKEPHDQPVQKIITPTRVI
ncbi:5-formyltetrahydrofolate cyclo-ligase [Scopulibacillus darangshiensis]|uniref:5-formyltetrahydrofolate cyclo-ligase n=1 Tax=Scopulibacillus darangshiensis TaxID=442528 RepID=A0A4R2P9V9_9BACL|nr:5-formyltetrahydrofolate cyclo-ligase [Scopulibacillus darangshiensis]TCP31138.1 5-formyltetrahydrofolate cyclo-ligase [Scopulibacillus darangshiensis]